MRNWPYAYLTLKAGGSAVSDRVGVAPLPGPGALGGQNLAVAACSEDKASALDFIEDVTGAGAQQELFEKGGYPPTRKALYRRRYGNRPVQKLAHVVAKAIDKAKLRPRRPGYTQASEIIQGVADEVIRGGLTPADAIAKLDDELGHARLE